MSAAYGMHLSWGEQRGTEDSYIGGKPRLPAGQAVPACELCGRNQTFFLQVAFPSGHAWHGSSLAVFACTGCADEQHLVPEMTSGPLARATIASAFLRAYQRNFRLLVLPTGAAKLVEGYEERIRYRPIELRQGERSSLGRIGGSPDWLLEDESPGTLDGTRPFVFLLQLGPGIQFETVPGAPAQLELGLDGTPEPSPNACYELFIGNAAYFFGPETPVIDGVYALTQVD